MDARGRVIVAGAGPVGLLTALALASRDVPVLVLEAEAALTHDLRAGTFHPPTLEMMAPYGITDEMHRTGIKVPRWQHRDRNEGVIAEWDLSLIADETPYPYRFHLEQHRLTPIIFDRLMRLPHAAVRFGARVVDVVQDADRVSVAAETTDGVERFEGAWLVGADGGRSAVRKAIGVEFEGFTWPERFVVVSTRYDFGAHGFTPNAYVADPDQWAAVFKMPDAEPGGLWRIAFPVPPDEPDEVTLSAAEIERRMQYFVPRAEALRDPVQEHLQGASARGEGVPAGPGAARRRRGASQQSARRVRPERRHPRRDQPRGQARRRVSRRRRRIAPRPLRAPAADGERRVRPGRLDPEPPHPRRARSRGAAARFDELRRANADPQLARQFLLQSSMIASVRRAAAIA